MAEALDGLDDTFTIILLIGLTVWSFIAAVGVAAVSSRWTSLSTAVGIGTVVGAWSGFLSAGEVLKNFEGPFEQVLPLLAFGLVACATRVGQPWQRVRRFGMRAAAVVMAVQMIVTAFDLAALADGRFYHYSQEYPLPVPRAGAWWVLAAPAPVLIVGLIVRFWYRRRNDSRPNGSTAPPAPAPAAAGRPAGSN